MVDFGILKRTWTYSKPDFAAVAATLLATLAIGVETGLVVGVGVSLALYLFRTSQPRIAIVGLVLHRAFPQRAAPRRACESHTGEPACR